MNPFYCLFAGLLLMGCTQVSTYSENARKERERDSLYSHQLVEANFMAFTDSAISDSVEKVLLESFHIYQQELNRFVMIDAEELAELSFDFFLPELNQILGKRGLSLEITMTPDVDQSHEIFMNGKKIKLFTEKEMDENLFWETASRNFFQQVNALLAAQNQEERCYLMNGGNDLHVMLMTEKHVAIITARHPDELIYLP